MQSNILLQDHAEKRFRRLERAIPPTIDVRSAASPWFVPVDALEAQVEEAGGDFASLAHYDYLSLARHPAVLDAAVGAVRTFGVGVGASRLVGGERTVHRALEDGLAEFLGHDAALCLSAGYLVSLTLIPHLVGATDLIIVDSLSHNSIALGCKASRAKVMTFRHGDLDHLAEILEQERPRHRFCLVIVESLYSMDGDIVDLPRLVELRRTWNTWLMVDEAHSIGVLGATGRGICEHFGIPTSEIDILVGTLSKTFVGTGGFVCGRAILIDWLRFSLPGFVFSAGLSPVVAATALAVLDILKSEPDRVARLHAISRYFLETARAAGFSTGDAIGIGIVPVLFERQEDTLMASDALIQAGIYVPPVVQIGVPGDAPRLRFFLSADMPRALVDRTFEVLKAMHFGPVLAPVLATEMS